MWCPERRNSLFSTAKSFVWSLYSRWRCSLGTYWRLVRCNLLQSQRKGVSGRIQIVNKHWVSSFIFTPRGLCDYTSGCVYSKEGALIRNNGDKLYYGESTRAADEKLMINELGPRASPFHRRSSRTRRQTHWCQNSRSGRLGHQCSSNSTGSYQSSGRVRRRKTELLQAHLAAHTIVLLQCI